MNTYVIVFENGDQLNLNTPYSEKDLLDKFNEEGQYIILGDYLLPKYQIKWIEIKRFPQYDMTRGSVSGGLEPLTEVNMKEDL